MLKYFNTLWVNRSQTACVPSVRGLPCLTGVEILAWQTCSLQPYRPVTSALPAQPQASESRGVRWVCAELPSSVSESLISARCFCLYRPTGVVTAAGIDRVLCSALCCRLQVNLIMTGAQCSRPESVAFWSCDQGHFTFWTFFFKHLFIWLHWVLVAACRIFYLF